MYESLSFSPCTRINSPCTPRVRIDTHDYFGNSPRSRRVRERVTSCDKEAVGGREKERERERTDGWMDGWMEREKKYEWHGERKKERRREGEGEGEPSDRKKGRRVEKKRGEESGRNRSAVRDREANREGPFLPLKRRLQKRLGERSNGHVTSRTTVAARERSTFFNGAMETTTETTTTTTTSTATITTTRRTTRTIDFHRKRGHSLDDAA